MGAAFVLLIKWYTITPQYWVIFLALLVSAVEAYGYYRVFKVKGAATGYSVTRGISIFLVTVVSVAAFHEKLTWSGIIGILLVAVGIALVH